jgi:hypothetical protein
MILAPKNVKSKKGVQPKVPKPPVTKNTDANEEKVPSEELESKTTVPNNE